MIDIRVVLVRRESNAVANELAHLARRTVHAAVWLGQSRSCIADLIRSDCNHDS